MAIPTQFSVTRTITTPIANPLSPKDLPSNIKAEKINVVGGGGFIPTLSVGDIDSPNEVTAESISIISSSEVVPSQAATVINEPSNIEAETAAAAETPSNIEAEESQSTDSPSTLPVKAAVITPSPSALSVESSVATPLPSALTSSVSTLITPPFPLNHARILWDNIIFNYTNIQVSEGTNGTYVAIPSTADKWAFDGDGGAGIAITLDAQYPCDTICIGAHNLEGCIISAFYSESDTGGYTLFSTQITATKNAIMIHVGTEVNARRIQINIGNSFGNKYVGYISAGVALQMQRPFFNGHTPITDGDVTEYYSNRSESGEIIGQSIRRIGYQTTADWANINDAWYRAYFKPFKEAAKLQPFFFAWNLAEYPDDVGLCRISQDISAPMQNGTMIKRGGISMTLLGVA